jgi:predicted amidohydrolase YtcJ
VAIRAGKITYVGSNTGVKAYIGAKTRVTDLKGRMLMPSFAEAHCHVSSAVSFLYAVSLCGLGSLADYQAAVAQFATDNPALESIQGNGWSEALFPGIGPLKGDLDSVVSDRPVALWSDGHHSLWVNSAALDLAGIDGNTPDPIGGVIERVPGTVGQPDSPYGVPSGTLRESATDVMMAVFPDFTVDQYVDAIRFYEQEIGNPLGITLAQDAVLEPGDNAIAAYEKLRAVGQLTMRVRGSLKIFPNQPLKPQIDAAVAEKAKHHGGLFQTNTAKFFADGVIEGHTGYLLEDYADRPGYRGEPIWQPIDMNAGFLAADKAGLQIHVHAIGNAAVSESLDAIAYAEAVDGPRDRRPMITHLQLVDLNDFARFHNLKVTAQPQPHWFLMDDYYHDLQVPFLGQTRVDLEYPMKSFFDAGVKVASSSDFPVTSSPDALQAIQIGVMRWYPTSAMGGTIPPGDVLWPEQCVTVKQMIRSFTINGAYANFLEKTTGSLKVGKSADMIVLKRNILKCAPDQIGEGNKVLLTVFRGKTVYRDKAF